MAESYDVWCLTTIIIWLIEKYKIIVNLINWSIDNSFVLKQETKSLISAQTGNRTIEIHTSIDRILSVDHWPLQRKDMQLIIDSNYFNYVNSDYSN